MSHPNITIANQLGAAQLAVNNTLADAEIKAFVAAYGYDEAKLAEGSRLIQAAQAATIAQGEAVGAQKAASQTCAAAQTQAFKAYQALAKVARAAADPAVLAGLGLGGPMPRSANAFQQAALQLFGSSASLSTLAAYGYDAARLSAERAKISAFAVADQRQEAAKGAAQQATREQDAALLALKQWTTQYLKIARVALDAKPELLEKIGVIARSAPTAAQRAARQKKAPALS